MNAPALATFDALFLLGAGAWALFSLRTWVRSK